MSTTASQTRAILTRRELLLRRDFAGKTLLGEIVFGQDQCNEVAGLLTHLVDEQGATPALTEVSQRWPYVLAVWLVNEAFFTFASRKYWPEVLAKIGIVTTGPHSVKAGRAFLRFLEDHQLPRFRRLKTHWSYLGPILAHCGIPKSCLPEFFRDVLPRAAEYGVGEGEGFEDLLHDLGHLYLTKTTKRFLLFGEQVAQDFVRRAVELRSIWLTEGSVPDPTVVGLPKRVVDVFADWTKGEEPIGRPSTSRRLARPLLCLDPASGLVLSLPAQALASEEVSLRWFIEPDPGDAEHVDVLSHPGQRTTADREFLLAEPFSALKVQLSHAGRSLGSWTFPGITRENAVLFFDNNSLAVISSQAVGAGPVGIVHPGEWRVFGLDASGKEVPARVTEDLGVLPFGWQHLSARIYDLAEFEHVFARSQDGSIASKHVELGEVITVRPRLLCRGGRNTRESDGTTVMIGGTPEVEFWLPPHQTEQEFRRAWTIEVKPDRDMEGRLASFEASLTTKAITLSSRTGNRFVLDLTQEELLGRSHWGQFEVRVRGPIGQDARFPVRLLPDIRIEHDWTEWSDHPEGH